VRARSLIGSVAAAAALVAVVAVPSVAQTSGVHRWLGSVGLVPTSASFSELALTQYDDLYHTVDNAGHTKFDAVATNVSTKSKSYTWTVSVGPVGKAQLMQHGKLTLAGGQSATIKVHFLIPDCHQRNLVTVALNGPDARQPSLHYWVLDRTSAAWRESGGPGCGA
jgi:hypothetical protein